jgi:hypothetical protein
MDTESERPRWAPVAAIAAVAFGLLTLAAGGTTLFGGDAAQPRDVVPFVLWFNVLSGALYVVAGVGLFLWKPWGARLSMLIAAAILVVFALLGLHIAAGGAFETRTVVAMAVRSGFWVVVAIAACRALTCRSIRPRSPNQPVQGRTR